MEYNMEIIKNDEAKTGTSYVYFANCETGFTKIGTTKRSDNRLKQVSHSNHIPINEYFLVEGGTHLEKTLHKVFAKQRMYAEWFYLDYEELKLFIEKDEYDYTTDKADNKKNLVIASNGIYSKQYEDFLKAIESDNKIEKSFSAQQAYYCALVTEMIKGRIEPEETIIKELIEVTIKYNDFLENCSAPDEEVWLIIRENEKLVADVIRIGFVIEVSDTTGKDDKQIYQMVKEWLDGVSR